MSQAECPYCEESVRLSGTPRLGQRVICPHCGEKLEIISLDPLELDFEDEEYEDYDEFEDEDEDEWDEEDY